MHTNRSLQIPAERSVRGSLRPRAARTVCAMVVLLGMATVVQAQTDLGQFTQKWLDETLQRTMPTQSPLRMEVSVGQLDERLRLTVQRVQALLAQRRPATGPLDATLEQLRENIASVDVQLSDELIAKINATEGESLAVDAVILELE